MEKIRLKNHKSHFQVYNRERDMLIALVWSAVRKTLRELGREELFSYIKSIRLTERYIVIRTEKPIINAEIRLYQEILLREINMQLSLVHEKTRERLRFS